MRHNWASLSRARGYPEDVIVSYSLAGTICVSQDLRNNGNEANVTVERHTPWACLSSIIPVGPVSQGTLLGLISVLAHSAGTVDL